MTTVGLFFGFQDRYYYATAAYIIPKLYTNSILIILNSRIRILGGRATYISTIDIISTPTRDLAFASGSSKPSHLVTINREVKSDGDVDEPVEMKGMSGVRVHPIIAEKWYFPSTGFPS